MTAYSEIQQHIATATEKHDFDEVARLAQIASQLKSNEEQRNHLLASVVSNAPSQSTVQLLPPSNGSHVQKVTTHLRASSRGGLTVEFTTRGGAPIRVCERTSADTIGVLMERILIQFGMPGLEKLMGLRVNRGPLVSRDPRKDYAYGKGQVYANRRIAGTNLYVLTHSSNPEKLRYIPAALRMLGLPDGAFRVSLE